MTNSTLAMFFALIFGMSLSADARSPPRSTGNHPVMPSGVFPYPENPPSSEVVLSFWNANGGARMKDAWTTLGKTPSGPPPGKVITPDGDASGYSPMTEPYAQHKLSRVTGILFFRETENQSVKACSASVIHSNSESLILTAAHCFIQGQQLLDMQMFVPAYRQYEDHLDMRLGQWPVKIAFFPYKDAQLTQDDDLAVARVYPRGAKKLEQIVGEGLHPRISTTHYFPRVSIIGYPGIWIVGDEPYNVARQRYCESDTRQSEHSAMAMQLHNCAPQPGNSGGPTVLQNINPTNTEVVGIFTNMPRVITRLTQSNFRPIYEAADSAF